MIWHYLSVVWCLMRRHPLNYHCPEADEHGNTVMVEHCYCCAILERSYV